MRRSLADFVEEFLNRLADALQPSALGHRQIGMGDEPAFCGDLVLDDPVFYLRMTASFLFVAFDSFSNGRATPVRDGVARDRVSFRG